MQKLREAIKKWQKPQEKALELHKGWTRHIGSVLECLLELLKVDTDNWGECEPEETKLLVERCGVLGKAILKEVEEGFHSFDFNPVKKALSEIQNASWSPETGMNQLQWSSLLEAAQNSFYSILKELVKILGPLASHPTVLKCMQGLKGNPPTAQLNKLYYELLKSITGIASEIVHDYITQHKLVSQTSEALRNLTSVQTETLAPAKSLQCRKGNSHQRKRKKIMIRKTEAKRLKQVRAPQETQSAWESDMLVSCCRLFEMYVLSKPVRPIDFQDLAKATSSDISEEVLSPLLNVLGLTCRTKAQSLLAEVASNVRFRYQVRWLQYLVNS